MANLKELINLPYFEYGFLENIIKNLRDVDQLKKNKKHHYLIDFNEIVFFGHLVKFYEHGSQIWIKGRDNFKIFPENKKTIINSYMSSFSPLIKTDSVNIELFLSNEDLIEIINSKSIYLGFWIEESTLDRLNFIFATKGMSLKFQDQIVNKDLIKKIEKQLSKEVLKIFNLFFETNNYNALLPLLKCHFNYQKDQICLNYNI